MLGQGCHQCSKAGCDAHRMLRGPGALRPLPISGPHPPPQVCPVEAPWVQAILPRLENIDVNRLRQAGLLKGCACNRSTPECALQPLKPNCLRALFPYRLMQRRKDGAGGQSGGGGRGGGRSGGRRAARLGI